MATHTVVMVRTGSCELNEENVFPGWFDTVLSENGRQGAREAGETLKRAGYQFDVAFTSVLTRARETLHIILETLGQPDLPVETSWRLNDRHYGALTGLNRAELAETYGEQQVLEWRRSYDVAPPPMRPTHPYHAAIVGNRVYADGPPPEHFPDTESLRMTMARVLPYWTGVVAPRVRSGDRVLVCAHGNSLRGLVKFLENKTDQWVANLNIPMTIPFVYELDANLEPVAPIRFLADMDVLLYATEAIKAQIKKPN